VQTNNLVDTLLELGLQSINKKQKSTNGTTADTTTEANPESQQNQDLKKLRKEKLNSLLNLGLETLKEAAKKNVEIKPVPETSTPSSPQPPSTP
jgi:coproporphyrinogen III oxidase-like Fe-S oxidoreductase